LHMVGMNFPYVFETYAGVIPYMIANIQSN